MKNIKHGDPNSDKSDIDLYFVRTWEMDAWAKSK
jgi:hypothetical protein